jgi:hypothetical protein
MEHSNSPLIHDKIYLIIYDSNDQELKKYTSSSQIKTMIYQFVAQEENKYVILGYDRGGRY